MMKRIISVVIFFLISFYAAGQQPEINSTYTLDMLSQEPVSLISRPAPSAPKEAGDTTFTIYEGSSVALKTYFVNGEQYDNIFNPNPTGIYINNQHYSFYCSMEQTIRQNFSNILEVKEFSYLGKTYLMLINYREDCLGEGCRYRCYNIFDISDAKHIYQVSFSSLFEGVASFGEFNMDGVLDFVRVVPKASPTQEEGKEHYLLTVYTIKKGNVRQLKNAEGMPYYLYVEADKNVKSFKVLQADWFFSIKDTTGNAAEATPYFAPYISFDPMYRYLYSPDGIRIEKNRWSVHVKDLKDLEAAQTYCRRMQKKGFEDVYIMIDQYGGEITYQIFMGNFISKDMAVHHQVKLRSVAIEGKLADLRNMY
ncbi:hypothetical protein AAG747_14670 [Rapidithrix thailandica]|uniref:SPOR domain-containing protein n=1 Tax=Rapidithrix thailandica TaxID=413964 RepID=A0AAW9RWH7_9BACT